MTLNDLIQSINGNETELILDKFPIENGYYEFENEKDFNDELLEKNGKHYTKMKKRIIMNLMLLLLLFIKILFIF